MSIVDERISLPMIYAPADIGAAGIRFLQRQHLSARPFRPRKRRGKARVREPQAARAYSMSMASPNEKKR